MQRKTGGNLCLRFCATCAAGDAQLQTHPILRMSINANVVQDLRSAVVHEIDYPILWLASRGHNLLFGLFRLLLLG